jgi:DNA-binding transcriptional LysR family regulator
VFDLKQLQYAATLSRHRNYARAAEVLDMSLTGRPEGEYRSAQHEGTPVSQPALSRSISGLEAALTLASVFAAMTT